MKQRFEIRTLERATVMGEFLGKSLPYSSTAALLRSEVDLCIQSLIWGSKTKTNQYYHHRHRHCHYYYYY